jgi:hypothetical protein
MEIALKIASKSEAYHLFKKLLTEEFSIKWY